MYADLSLSSKAVQYANVLENIFWNKGQKMSRNGRLLWIILFQYFSLSSSSNRVNLSVQFSSVTQSGLTLCDPMDSSMPGLPVHHQLLELTQTHVHRLVMPSSHFIFCHPLLLLPSILPSIRVFSNKSVLCIRWPKYWEFQLHHQSFQ